MSSGDLQEVGLQWLTISSASSSSISTLLHVVFFCSVVQNEGRQGQEMLAMRKLTTSICIFRTICFYLLPDSCYELPEFLLIRVE